MSRIGKKAIQIPKKVKLAYKDNILTVEGEKGTLKRKIHSEIDLNITEEQISVIPKTNNKKSSAFHGLTRALVSNMVAGVSKGFSRELEINGIGYRAEQKGNNIIFNLGYSSPISFKLSDGIEAKVEKNKVVLFGIDKELLGHTAASIRRLRPPEPYKGKGIKYSDEIIHKKAGKTGTK
jgi:large subunit ribosomal protein L6